MTHHLAVRSMYKQWAAFFVTSVTAQFPPHSKSALASFKYTPQTIHNHLYMIPFTNKLAEM